MLPPDIIREILRFLSNHKPTLLNCALVSQEWLFESRPFIFRSIDILSGNSDASDLFVSNILRSERLRPWLTSIHHLSFGFIITPNLNDEDFIVEISKCLSNLRTMTWGCFGLPKDERPLRPEVFAAFGKFACLHYLEITSCFFLSFEDLKKVIVAFPSLSSLRLSEVSCRHSADPDQSSSAALSSGHIWPKTLSKLSFSTPNYLHPPETVDNVLLWLSTTPTRYLLRELSLHLCNIGAALKLTANTSLAALNVQMDDDDSLLSKVHSYPLSSKKSDTLTQPKMTALRL